MEIELTGLRLSACLSQHHSPLNESVISLNEPEEKWDSKHFQGRRGWNEVRKAILLEQRQRNENRKKLMPFSLATVGIYTYTANVDSCTFKSLN